MGATVDGIMGLWYYPQGSEIPILNVLKNSSALTQPQIGVWLKSSSSEANAPGGEITFGGADTSRYSGDISYVNCGGNSPWTVSLSFVNERERKKQGCCFLLLVY